MSACPICGNRRTSSSLCRRCASRRQAFRQIRAAGGRTRLGMPGRALSLAERCAVVAAKVRRAGGQG